MRLFNADGGTAEVSGNGVRGLAALLLQGDDTTHAAVTIETEAGAKDVARLDRSNGRQTFRTSMGAPLDIRQVPVAAGGETVQAVVMNFGNPQCIVLGPLPSEDRFRKLGSALERHPMFPAGTNVEFTFVERPDTVQDPDLGAGRRSHDVIRHRIVRRACRRGLLWRRPPLRHRRGSGWLATRRMAGRRGLPDGLGRGRLRRGVAPRPAAIGPL